MVLYTMAPHYAVYVSIILLIWVTYYKNHHSYVLPKDSAISFADRIPEYIGLLFSGLLGFCVMWLIVVCFGGFIIFVDVIKIVLLQFVTTGDVQSINPDNHAIAIQFFKQNIMPIADWISLPFSYFLVAFSNIFWFRLISLVSIVCILYLGTSELIYVYREWLFDHNFIDGNQYPIYKVCYQQKKYLDGKLSIFYFACLLSFVIIVGMVGLLSVFELVIRGVIALIQYDINVLMPDTMMMFDISIAIEAKLSYWISSAIDSSIVLRFFLACFFVLLSIITIIWGGLSYLFSRITISNNKC